MKPFSLVKLLPVELQALDYYLECYNILALQCVSSLIEGNKFSFSDYIMLEFKLLKDLRCSGEL